MGVALSCTLYSHFFYERHCAGQKETDLCKNEDKYLTKADFELCLFTEEEDVGEIGF